MPHSTCIFRLSIATACFLLSFLQASAHQKNLDPNRVCHTLNVGHRLEVPEDPKAVSIKLVDSQGKEGDCYEPNQLYDLSIKVTDSDRSILGLLIVQERPFPGQFPPQGSRIPAGLTTSLCSTKRSFAHKCRDGSNCNLGRTINLPYRAPNNRDATVEFRYSIVFTEHDFLEDKDVHFHACPLAPPVEPCEQKDFVIPKDFEGDDTKILCKPNPRRNFSEERSYKEDGVNYNCSIIYRKKTCATGCMLASKRRCCGHEIPDRMKAREFTCTDEKGNTIMRSFDVPNPKGCVCFDCATVCPAPGFSSGDSQENHGGNLDVFV